MNQPTRIIPMKTTRLASILVASLLASVISLPLAAQGPGRGGRGPGHGGGGPGGFQEAIHTLFDNHTKIKRSVELTSTGYKSRTVSDDPEIAKTLQKHVREMRERLGSGLMIRRWDPAFAELVEHYEDIDHEFKEVDGGVEMVASGKTPEAVKVAQNHARIVSGFVEKGPAQMHESHARALADKESNQHDTSELSPTEPAHDHDASVDSQSESGTPEPAAEAKAKTRECCQKAAGKAGAACCPKTTEQAKTGCCRAKKNGANRQAPTPAK